MRWFLLALIIVLLMLGLSYLSISDLSDNVVNKDIIVNKNIVESLEKPKIEENIEQPKIEDEKKPSSMKIEEEIDLCEYVICQNSKKTCPDGFVASCSNSCSQGICSNCDPDCSEHQIQEESIQDQEESIQENQDQQKESQESKTSETPQTEYQKPKIISIKYDADGDDRKKINWPSEWVVITGNNINMLGWILSDEANHTFIFPDFVINEKVIIHSGYGDNNQTDLFWEDGPIWNNNGDTAYLRDNNGNLVDKYSY